MYALKTLLKPPVFADEGSTRHARILHALLLYMAFAIIGLGGLGILLVFPEKLVSTGIIAVGAVVLAVAYYLNQRGKVIAASQFVLVIYWLLITLLASVSQGMRSLDIMFYVSGTVIAGLLLGARGALFFAGISLITGLVMVILGNTGLVVFPNLFPFPDRFGLVLLLINLSMTVIPLNMTISALVEALERARAELAERIKAETAMQQSEDMYRRAIMVAGAVPYYLDQRTHTYTFMGEGILPITGYSVSEMNPDLWESLEEEGFPRGNLAHLTYEEADRITEEDNSIPWECDYRIHTRDGQTRWVADTSVKGFNEKGERVGVIGILQDITDRKLAEQALKRYADRLEIMHDIDRAILAVRSPEETAQSALVHIRRLIPCSRASVSLFDIHTRQVSLLALSTDGPTRMYPGGQISFEEYGVDIFESLQQDRPYLVKDLLTLSPIDDVSQQLINQGIRCWLACPLFYQGQLIGALNLSRNEPDSFTPEYIEIASDVANQIAIALQQSRLLNDIQHLNVDLETRVAQRTMQLEIANKELDSFSYSVSHDLRAPLRAVSSYAQLIRADYGHLLPAEGQDFISKVIMSAQQMHALIESLLSLSRMSRGELDRKMLNLTEMAKEIIQNYQLNEPDRSVAWVVADGLTASADEKLMHNVLHNLIGNAWKYTARTDAARIAIGMEINSGETVFFVRDNGIGFDMKYSDKLFGAFQRLHTADEFPGHGIGLASVRRIVTKHGGRIWAEAAPDKGATFYFTLGNIL